MIYAILVLIIVGLMLAVQKYIRMYLVELDETLEYMNKTLMGLGEIINLRKAVHLMFFEPNKATLEDMNFWSDVQNEAQRLYDDHISFEAWFIERLEAYQEALAEDHGQVVDEETQS